MLSVIMGSHRFDFQDSYNIDVTEIAGILSSRGDDGQVNSVTLAERDKYTRPWYHWSEIS